MILIVCHFSWHIPKWTLIYKIRWFHFFIVFFIYSLFYLYWTARIVPQEENSALLLSATKQHTRAAMMLLADSRIHVNQKNKVILYAGRLSGAHSAPTNDCVSKGLLVNSWTRSATLLLWYRRCTETIMWYRCFWHSQGSKLTIPMRCLSFQHKFLSVCTTRSLIWIFFFL
jgi:hypothetical protein